MENREAQWQVDVLEADFQQAVIEQSHERPVVVDFWAPWCGPCKMLGPLLEKLAKQRRGEFLLAKVNVDEAQDLAAQFQVSSIPAVKAFVDGVPVSEFVGLLSEEELEQWVDALCPSEADELVKQALALKSTDTQAAEDLFRRALAFDTRHEAALLGLTEVLASRGQDEEAAKLLEQVSAGADTDNLSSLLRVRRRAREFGESEVLRHQLEESPGDADLNYRLGCVLAANQEYEEALDRFLAAAKADRAFATSSVREAMVDVFHVVGIRSPLADQYRKKLSSLLY